jgi:predicted metal-dependent hydrolase
VQEEQYVDINKRQVKVRVRRHHQARRVSLRLMPAAEGVVLTLPKRASLEKAMAFLHQKSDWVLAHVAIDNSRTRLMQGTIIPVLGMECTIQHTQGRGVTHLQDGMLYVYGAAEFTERRVQDFLKKHLQALCMVHAERMAVQVGKKVQSIRISNMQARWGSCSAGGRLAFNWRLVFAPAPIVEYLVAHEVAHLVEMNHSPRFWHCVATLCPEFQQARIWLKRHGQSLYCYS